MEQVNGGVNIGYHPARRKLQQLIMNGRRQGSDIGIYILWGAAGEQLIGRPSTWREPRNFSRRQWRATRSYCPLNRLLLSRHEWLGNHIRQYLHWHLSRLPRLAL